MGTEPRRRTRIVVRGLEVIHVLREFLRIDMPIACFVGLVQIGVEDDDGLEGKDLVDQFSELRTRLDVQVHLQRTTRELVEILHLSAPRVRLTRVFRYAC